MGSGRGRPSTWCWSEGKANCGLIVGRLECRQRAPKSQDVSAVKVPGHHTEKETEEQKGEMIDSRSQGARNAEAKPEFLSP